MYARLAGENIPGFCLLIRESAACRLITQAVPVSVGDSDQEHCIIDDTTRSISYKFPVSIMALYCGNCSTFWKTKKMCVIMLF